MDDEHVVMWDPDVRWSGGAPDAVLISTDWAGTVLALKDEAPGQCVVLCLSEQGSDYASLLGINDEGLRAHGLYDKGLAEVSAGRVLNSRRVAELKASSPRRQNEDLRHYVLALKESVAEFVCVGDPEIKRLSGTTLQAALAALEELAVGQ